MEDLIRQSYKTITATAIACWPETIHVPGAT